MTVVYFHRKAEQSNHFAVEESFDAMRTELPRSVAWRLARSRFGSRGLPRRVYNAAEAVLRQGDVNHVTGDVNYLALALRGRRTVLTILDCGFEERPPGLTREAVRLLWLTLPVRHVAAVTAVSEFTRQRVLALEPCDPGKVRVIPSCISPVFVALPKPEAPARLTVLQIGTAPNKNIERLAAALSGLDCRLRVIGRLSASQQQALDASRVEYSNASFLALGDMLDEYRRADIVTLASTYEGFGMPILEAHTVGRPVITSRVASMPEVAGDAAVLVDPFDVRSIRDGAARLLASPDLRASLVRRGFANARRFDRREVAAAYARLYEEVSARSG